VPAPSRRSGRRPQPPQPRQRPRGPRPGAGVTPPRIARQPPLQYPPVAKRLKKEATVIVRVLVDENGRPVDVEGGGAKVGFGMDEAAQSYARNCLWEPAKKGGVPVKIWWELRVAFKLWPRRNHCKRGRMRPPFLFLPVFGVRYPPP
jgi:protein TonB